MASADPTWSADGCLPRRGQAKLDSWVDSWITNGCGQFSGWNTPWKSWVLHQSPPLLSVRILVCYLKQKQRTILYLMYPSCKRSTDYSKSVVYFVESKKTDISTLPLPPQPLSAVRLRHQISNALFNYTGIKYESEYWKHFFYRISVLELYLFFNLCRLWWFTKNCLVGFGHLGHKAQNSCVSLVHLVPGVFQRRLSLQSDNLLTMPSQLFYWFSKI